MFDRTTHVQLAMMVSILFWNLGVTAVEVADAEDGSRKLQQIPPESLGLSNFITLEDRCAREVYRLHVFFEQWWNGHLPHTHTEFDEQFSAVMDPKFAFISPEGLPLGLSDTKSFIYNSYGTKHTEDWMKPFVNNFDMRFNITDLRVTWSDEATQTCTVIFQENQQVGGSSGPVQAKRNACTLVHKAGTPNQLAWVLEHETWWPGFESGRSSCPSLIDQSSISNTTIAACFGCTRCLPANCHSCLNLT
jgi:hypothetical protein